MTGVNRAFAADCEHAQNRQLCVDFRPFCHEPVAANSGAREE
jgi:hypothetical protein